MKKDLANKLFHNPGERLSEMVNKQENEATVYSPWRFSQNPPRVVCLLSCETATYPRNRESKPQRGGMPAHYTWASSSLVFLLCVLNHGFNHFPFLWFVKRQWGWFYNIAVYIFREIAAIVSSSDLWAIMKTSQQSKIASLERTSWLTVVKHLWQQTKDS